MLSDLKSAFRSLRKSPGFAAAAVLVLALGIGANTAIFSVVQAALLRPLPFPQPDRLVRLFEALDEANTRAGTFSFSELSLQQWRDHGQDIFAGLAAASGASTTYGAQAGVPARSFNAARITANFFATLGLSPALGRSFTAEEDRPGGARVAIVSHAFWTRELGARGDVIGRTILLDDAPHTIVGVMPKTFRHPYRADVWLPLAAEFSPSGSRGHYLYALGRLQPGLSPPAADAAIRRMCAAINAAAPNALNPRRAYVVGLHESFVLDLKPKLLVIAGAAFCALLIAAANFAGLLLARSVARENEIAIRAALGASRRRLVRETLAQALVLAAAGTLVGLLFAAWLTPALVALSPEGADTTGSALREFDHTVRLDLPVFAFAAGAMLLAGLGFGLLPAWRAARTDLRTAMGNGARSVTLDHGTRRLLSTLVVGEIAAAAVLLVGSALFTQYFRQLVNEPWGVATEQRLGFNAMLNARLYPDAASRLRTVEQTLTELRALPGARSATVTLPHPMSSARQLMSNNPDGYPPPQPRGFFLAYLRATMPGYFQTVGQALIRGRDFTVDDRAGTQPVCIVSESYARRYWPNQDPLGKRVKWGRIESPRPWMTIVGVAADAKAIVDPNDGEINGTLYLPLPQVLAASLAFTEMTFVLETESDPRALETGARAALARADSRLAAYQVLPFATLATDSRVTERFALVLVSLFGVLGLVLCAIGLYGLLSLQVSRRTREFGVRSALGATAAQIVGLVVSQAGRLLLGGFTLGGGAAWAALRIAQNRWPELPALHALPFVVAGFVLAAAVTLAGWLPARRAARVDPMTALRTE